LLEAIAVACGFNAEGGSKNFRFGTHRPCCRFLHTKLGAGHPLLQHKLCPVTRKWRGDQYIIEYVDDANLVWFLES
jgi:hypothetical protein